MVATQPMGSSGRGLAAEPLEPARRERRTPGAGGLALGLTFLGLATMGFGTAEVGGAPLSDWVFVVAVSVVVANLLMGKTADLLPGRHRRAVTATLTASLVMLTAATFSSFWAEDPFASMLGVVRLAWLTLIWFWLLRTVTPDRAALNRLIVGFKVAVVVSSLAALAGYLGLVTFQSADGRDFGNRQFAFYGHPNILAGLLSVGTLFFLYDMDLTGRPASPQRTWIRYGLFGLVAFALGTTGSMGGTLGAVLGMAVMVVARTLAPEKRRGYGPRITPLKLLGLTLVAAASLYWAVQSGSPVIERLTFWSEGDTATGRSVSSRGEFADYVLDHVDERLVIGVGLDGTAELRNQENLLGAGHNMPLKLLYEAGVPAVVGLVMLLAITLHQGWQLVRSTRETPLYPVAVVFLGSVVAANVAAQSQPLFSERYYWLPIALVGVLWSVRRYELTTRRDDVSDGPETGPLPRPGLESNPI